MVAFSKDPIWYQRNTFDIGDVKATRCNGFTSICLILLIFNLDTLSSRATENDPMYPFSCFADKILCFFLNYFVTDMTCVAAYIISCTALFVISSSLILLPKCYKYT